MNLPPLEAFSRWAMGQMRTKAGCPYGGACYPSLGNQVCIDCYEADNDDDQK